MGITLPIHRRDFGTTRRAVFESDHFRAERFVYDSGVAALQIWNQRGSIVVLPFRGQQIWDARFDGIDLKMQSQFDEPTASLAFLESYGAFFVHCGITAMGDPAPHDSHPLHGELPTAAFEGCRLELSSDGRTLRIGGTYRHRIAFECDYVFESAYILTASSAMIGCEAQVTNHRASPLELMYLGHVNFLPRKASRSFSNHQDEIPISGSDGAHITERLSGRSFPPGTTGRTLEWHADRSADYVWQNATELPYAIRWLCQTDRERAMGLALPATALTTGLLAERAAGRVVQVPGHGVWRASFGFGHLSEDEAIGELEDNPDMRE